MKPFCFALISILLAGCSSFPPFGKTACSNSSNQEIQRIVDDAVEARMKSLHPKRMVVLVAEPKSGRILAMTGRQSGIDSPTSDPLSCMFEPGSTFKPFVIAAGLQERKITPESKIFCENGYFDFKGKPIKDHLRFGELIPEDILAKSSNIGAAKVSLLLKDKEYYDYVCRFGFGQKTGIQYLEEIPGNVIPPAQWNGDTKVHMAFGQSVAVTPIQLTMAYCAIANGGKLMKPVIRDQKPVCVRRVCSEKVANLVKIALQKTVSDQGTAPLARLENVTVGGKTGTSQAAAPDGHYLPDKYWTMFAGFFPVDHPKYVIVVVVDEADVRPECNYGGLVAAPVFSEIARKVNALGKN